LKVIKYTPIQCVPSSVGGWAEHCYYILTNLDNRPPGIIVAQWDDKINKAIWSYAPKIGGNFEEPTEILFEQYDRPNFRSFLAHLGGLLSDNTYIAGSTFKLQPENGACNDRLYAVFFANTIEFRYWIRLYISEKKGGNESNPSDQ